MGIEYRDYMSSESQYRAGGGSGWTAVQLLILANVLVFVVQTVFPDFLEPWARLVSPLVLNGQVWRLTTYDFLHDPLQNFPWHLVFNMLLLWIAGRRVEDMLGKNEFLAFYLLSGILSGAFVVVWQTLMGEKTPVIGASGAAISVMIVYAVNWPKDQWMIWGILPVPVVLIAAFSVISDTLPMLQQLGGRGPDDGIAHSAHVGGMLFGFLYARYRWRVLDWLPSSSGRKLKNPFRRRPKLRVHVPEHDQPVVQQERIPATVEARLDELLEKISQHGEASLTDEERRFLTDTSRRYRNRK